MSNVVLKKVHIRKSKTIQNKAELIKDTGLATEAMDYIHEPVLMHYVLDSFKQLPVPHVLVVRLVLDAVNHCGGRAGTHKTPG